MEGRDKVGAQHVEGTHEGEAVRIPRSLTHGGSEGDDEGDREEEGDDEEGLQEPA